MSRVISAPTTQPQSAPVKLSHELIAKRAYEKWLKKGRRHDTQVQDWVEAEAELKKEMPPVGAVPRR